MTREVTGGKLEEEEEPLETTRECLEREVNDDATLTRKPEGERF